MNAKSSQLTIAALIFTGGLVVASIFLGRGGFTVSGGGESGVKEFNVVMQNNRYNPSTLTANLGDRVIITFTNRDNVGHAVGIPEFNASVPGGHVFPGQSARMEFVANRKIRTDAATCGGPNPTDKTDGHGEELIINVI